ncbi:MAG: hypothetical protein Q4C96_01685 [Planctomycetia bacterium]|nr:hypothetical protein [Planctomycetia bacterium]
MIKKLIFYRFFQKLGFLCFFICILGNIPYLYAQETPAASAQLIHPAETPKNSASFLSRFNPANWKTPFSRDKKQNANIPPYSSSENAGMDSWAPVGTHSPDLPKDPYPSVSLTAPAPPHSSEQATKKRNVRGYESASELRNRNDGTENKIQPFMDSDPNLGGGNIGFPELYEVEKKVTHLPFSQLIQNKNMENLQEVRLYYSKDHGKNWHFYQKLSPQNFQNAPEKQAFEARVRNDGEYWFLITLVDGRGQETPKTREVPTFRIFVNTTGKPLDTSMLQQNASLAETGASRAENRTLQAASGNISSRNLVANSAPSDGRNRHPIQRPSWSPDKNAGPVISGNPPTEHAAQWNGSPSTHGRSFRDSVPFSVSEMNTTHETSEKMLPVYRLVSAEPVRQNVAKPSLTETSAHPSSPKGSLSEDTSIPAFADLPELSSEKENASATSALPEPELSELSLPEISETLPSEMGSVQTPEDSMTGEANMAELLNSSQNEKKTAASEKSSDVSSSMELFSPDFLASLEGPMNSARSHESHIRYTNNPRVEVEYDVSNVGSSGVGRVELWSTQDGGQSWNFLAEDRDRISPMQVELKAEGNYGLQIVVLNGAGVGTERPSEGTLPQMQITFDRTAPELVMQGVRLLADFGELEIRWDAYDLNFGAQCVVLSWSDSLEGKWIPLTPQALPNESVYTWRIPENLPGKIFVRVDAVDLAGNSTTLVTGPVITDLSRPSAKIINAKPAGK